MQCSELLAEQFCIAARTQFQMLQHQIALLTRASVRDGDRHPYRVGCGDHF